MALREMHKAQEAKLRDFNAFQKVLRFQKSLKEVRGLRGGFFYRYQDASRASVKFKRILR